MKTALVFGLVVLIGMAAIVWGGTDIDDYISTTYPLWPDTLTMVSAVVETSGVCRIDDGGGYFAITVWADTIATVGEDSVDLKLEYQLLQRDTKYKTAFTEDDSVTHGYGLISQLATTWQPVQEEGETTNWTTVSSSIAQLLDSRICYVLQPTLSEAMRFRVTGNTTTCDSCYVLMWLKMEP